MFIHYTFISGVFIPNLAQEVLVSYLIYICMYSRSAGCSFSSRLIRRSNVPNERGGCTAVLLLVDLHFEYFTVH